MSNIKIYESTNGEEMVAIDNGDSITSMPKSVYDEMLASIEANPTE